MGRGERYQLTVAKGEKLYTSPTRIRYCSQQGIQPSSAAHPPTPPPAVHRSCRVIYPYFSPPQGHFS